MAFTRNGQSAASTRTTTRAAQTAPQFETAGSAAMTPATPTKPVEIEAADGQHFAVSFEDVLSDPDGQHFAVSFEDVLSDPHGPFSADQVEFTPEDVAWFKAAAAERGFRFGSIK